MLGLASEGLHKDEEGRYLIGDALEFFIEIYDATLEHVKDTDRRLVQEKITTCLDRVKDIELPPRAKAWDARARNVLTTLPSAPEIERYATKYAAITHMMFGRFERVSLSGRRQSLPFIHVVYMCRETGTEA